MYDRSIRFSIIMIVSITFLTTILSESAFAQDRTCGITKTDIIKSLIAYSKNTAYVEKSHILSMIKAYIGTVDCDSDEIREAIEVSEAINNNVIPECSDGTPLSHCSENSPKYCYQGNLIDRCDICCPSGSCSKNGKCSTDNQNNYGDECTKTGGFNLQDRGTLSGATNQQTAIRDYCKNSTHIYEFTCSGNTSVKTLYSCTEQNYEGCYEGACYGGTAGRGCIKNGGFNLGERGALSGATNQVDPIRDYCRNSTHVYEFTCNGDTSVKTLYNCKTEGYTGCLDGACYGGTSDSESGSGSGTEGTDITGTCDTSKTYDDPKTLYISKDGSGDYNCDGANDEIEINQAIEKVSTDSAYDTVFLKGPATYVISKTVIMKSNVILTGDKDAVIKLKDNANWLKNVAMVEGNSVQNAAIRCFEIDGNRDNNRYVTNSEVSNFDAKCGKYYYTMIYFLSSSNIEIDNMYLHHNWNDILKFSQSSYVKFHDNNVRQPGHDVVYAIKSDHVWANDNYIRIYCNSGIRPDGTTNIYIFNNDIARDDGAGGYAGIEIQGASTVWMCNNNIHDTASTIVDLSDGKATKYTTGCPSSSDETPSSPSSTCECTKTGGFNLGERGTLSGATNQVDPIRDYCRNSTHIYEFTCSGDTSVKTLYNCKTEGYTGCLDGACYSGSASQDDSDNTDSGTEERDVSQACDTSKTYNDPNTIYIAPKGGTGDYVCDGTNDESEINQAISKVSSDSSYDTVFLKEGTYNIDNTITLKSNVILAGDTAAKIRLINNANWLSEVPIIKGESVSNIAIRCFEIDGNRDNNRYVTNSQVSNYDANCGKNYYSLMHFIGSSNIEIDNMYLHHNWNDIVKFSRGDNLKFLYNNVRQPGHDIVYGFRATNVWVGHNYMRIYCNSGARCDTCDNFYVYGNDIARDDGAGGNAAIELQGGSPDGGDMDVWDCDNTISNVRCVYDLEDGESCWTDRAPNNPFDGVIHTTGCPS